MITRHRTILHLEDGVGPWHYDMQTFSHNDEDGNEYESYTMSIPDWREMGQPDMITVTIEPGDALSDEKYMGL